MPPTPLMLSELSPCNAFCFQNARGEQANPVSSANCSKLTCLFWRLHAGLPSLRFRELTEASRYRLLTDRCVQRLAAVPWDTSSPGQIIRFCIFCNDLVNTKRGHHFEDVWLLDSKAFLHLFHIRIVVAICFCSPGKSRDVLSLNPSQRIIGRAWRMEA